MLIRIVRMHFPPENSETFLSIFNDIKTRIRTYPGCYHLELLQDSADPHVFITYSHWNSEASLNAYRSSDFFKTTWRQTKILFSEKPIVFSAFSIDRLP
jgi:quinol monooxygenase YgiN